MSVRASPASSPVTQAASGHLVPVDVVRTVVLGGVVAVHTISLTASPTSTLGGLGLVVLHVTREGFLLLSAFVLTYTQQRQPRPAVALWRRRYPLVVAPYVLWSVVYLLADGDLGSPVTVAARLGRDLVTAGARYHLYFLLLTFQLYLVFPWLYRHLAARPGTHGRVVALSVAFQLTFTAAVHYRLSFPAPVGTWLAHPGSWLPSYQLYVVAGAVAGLRYRQVLAWLENHGREVALCCGAALLVALASFAVDRAILHDTPLHASEVFQPAVAVESLAFPAGLVCVGLRVARRAPDRVRRRLAVGSDLSFGVYLAHPLVLQAVLAVAGTSVIGIPVGHLGGLAEAATVGLVVPVVLAVTSSAVALARRTSLSVALTGRPRAGR